MITTAGLIYDASCLLFVIGLILLTAWAFRRWQGGKPLAGFARPRPDSTLEILETRVIDIKRKLVLVRREGVAHLLLCGHERDIVVETGIPLPTAPDDSTTNPPRAADAAQ